VAHPGFDLAWGGGLGVGVGQILCSVQDIPFKPGVQHTPELFALRDIICHNLGPGLKLYIVMFYVKKIILCMHMKCFTDQNIFDVLAHFKSLCSINLLNVPCLHNK